MLFYPRLVSDAKTYSGVEGRRGNHKQRRKEKIIKSLQWTKKQVKDEGNHKMPCMLSYLPTWIFQLYNRSKRNKRWREYHVDIMICNYSLGYWGCSNIFWALENSKYSLAFGYSIWIGFVLHYQNHHICVLQKNCTPTICTTDLHSTDNCSQQPSHAQPKKYWMCWSFIQMLKIRSKMSITAQQRENVWE